MLSFEFFEKARRGESVYAPSVEQEISWATIDLGDLTLPSGRVVACDPLVDYEAEPFASEVTPGSYPVRLYLARIGTDERVAYAALWFSTSEVASWEPALLRGQDPRRLEPGEIFGYGVDSGTGCFQTPEALALLNSRMERESDYFEQILAAMEKTYVHTRSWARVQPEPSNPLSFLVFTTGFGDGFYGTHLGRDSSGKAACLVTDFDVAYIPETEVQTKEPARKWWQVWRR